MKLLEIEKESMRNTMERLAESGQLDLQSETLSISPVRWLHFLTPMETHPPTVVIPLRMSKHVDNRIKVAAHFLQISQSRFMNAALIKASEVFMEEFFEELEKNDDVLTRVRTFLNGYA